MVHPIDLLSQVELAARYPFMIEWLRRNRPFDQTEVYALIDVIDARYIAKIPHPGDPQPDVTPWATRWDADVQYIHQLDAEIDELMLASEVERRAFEQIVTSFLDIPEFDRETYEAFEYANSKDD